MVWFLSRICSPHPRYSFMDLTNYIVLVEITGVSGEIQLNSVSSQCTLGKSSIA